jgi:predicted dehydrogenase
LGTKASLSVPDLRLFSNRDGEAWHQPLTHAKFDMPATNAYTNQLAHFVEVMKRTTRPVVGIEEALATQAALEAVFVSAQQKRRVAIEDLIKAAYAEHNR